MRLYRMELYKLCHKKTFAVWSVLTVLIMVFYFCMMVNEKVTVVDGITYRGFDAVRTDRQITEAYRGGLNDEKVQDIVKTYGLPTEVKEVDRWWGNANYLNKFVTEYLSDGYIRSWDDYGIPTKVYAIADTELGDLQKAIGKQIPFAYTEGWQVFFDTLEAGMVPASILVVIAVSVLFAQESQTGMLPLLFTAQDGKETDTRAKIAAAFTLTVIVYSVVIAFDLVLCVCVFGLDGGDCPLSLAVKKDVLLNVHNAASYMPTVSFLWITAGFDLLAMILLCAVTLCASAYCRSNFGAVTAAAALWGLPLLIRILCGGFGYFLTSCMPLFLIFTGSVYESVSFGLTVPTISVALGLFMVCVEDGYRVYKRQC